MALPSQHSSSPSAVRAKGGGSLKISPRGAIGAVGVALVIAFVAWGLGQLLPKSTEGEGPGGTATAGLGGTALTDSTTGGTNTNRPNPVDLTNPEVASNTASTTSTATPAIGNSATPTLVQPNNNPSGTAMAANPAMGAAPTATPPTAPVMREVATLMADGEAALRDGKSVLARQKLSKALLHATATESEQATLRDKLTAINSDLLFSQKIVPGDWLVSEYAVQGGDSYDRIRKRQQLAVDWRLLERINRTPASRIRVGQKLKLVNGPFNVVVDKSDFRLDIYAGSPDDVANWIYIRSFNVGLGENDSTPIGTFKVKIGGKAVEPNWTNPRTGEQYDGKDPKNPIGNRWIGIEGLGSSSVHLSYGIHGTIDPDSIGKQQSMGCVRLVNSDVEQVYEMLVEDVSVVKIQQ